MARHRLAGAKEFPAFAGPAEAEAAVVSAWSTGTAASSGCFGGEFFQSREGGGA
jgi:hypothetical protein